MIVSVFTRLLLSLYLLEAGLLLAITPWSRFWDRNYFTALWPALALVMSNPYVKGAITGIGLVSVLAALSEISALMSKPPADRSTVRDHGA